MKPWERQWAAPQIESLDFSGIDNTAPPAAGDVDFLTDIAVEGPKPWERQWTPEQPGMEGGKVGAAAEMPPVPDVAANPKFIADDVAHSILYRGIPEGAAAMTPLGMGGNLARLSSEAVREGGHLLYKAATGEELPYVNKNPIPTSHDMLNKAHNVAFGRDIYEPKTRAGRYSNTAAQFATGGAVSGVPLTTTIPAAVASEAAGEATAGTAWEVPARIVAGAVVGGGVNRLKDAIKQPKQAPLTSGDVKAIASAKYAEVDKVGEIIKAPNTNKFLDTAKQKLLSDDDLINQMKSSKPLRDALDDLELFRDQPMNLKRAQALDEQLGDMMDSFTEMGRLNKQGVKIKAVQNDLRQMIDDVAEQTGSSVLKEGRAAWAAQAKLRDVEKIIQRAETMDNPSTGIKTGMRQLLTNPNKSKWFTKDELKIIEHAAKSGQAQDVIKGLGSRLIPIITAASGGGLAATALSTAGTMAARGAASKMQTNRALKLSDKITKPYQPPKPPSSNQLLLERVKKLEAIPAQ